MMWVGCKDIWTLALPDLEVHGLLRGLPLSVPGLGLCPGGHLALQLVVVHVPSRHVVGPGHLHIILVKRPPLYVVLFRPGDP